MKQQKTKATLLSAHLRMRVVSSQSNVGLPNYSFARKMAQREAAASATVATASKRRNDGLTVACTEVADGIGDISATCCEEEIPGPDVFKMPIGSFRIVPLHSKGKSSFVWKHFGRLAYITGGKQKTVGTDYYCKSCLTNSSKKEDSKPSNPAT